MVHQLTKVHTNNIAISTLKNIFLLHAKMQDYHLTCPIVLL